MAFAAGSQFLGDNTNADLHRRAAHIIDGRKIASDIISKLKVEVAALPFAPVFCDVLVGDDPVSRQYVDLKAKKAESIGIKFLRAEFPGNISTQALVEEIRKLNTADNLCGLIVQLPLPAVIARGEVLDAIDSKIDVDCIGKKRSEAFYAGDLEIVPPTAAAIMYILDSLKSDLPSKNILVVGQGELVGRPTTFLLKNRGLKVRVADINTKNPGEMMLMADVIISAVGKPKLITGEKIKPGCVVIDAGTSEDGNAIVGDADFGSVKNAASALSPVPGGVGPVTVAMLLSNVVKVAKAKQNAK